MLPGTNCVRALLIEAALGNTAIASCINLKSVFRGAFISNIGDTAKAPVEVTNVANGAIFVSTISTLPNVVGKPANV